MKRVLAAVVGVAGLATWSVPASAATLDEKLSLTITNSRSNAALCDVKVALLDADERGRYTLVSDGGDNISIITNRRGSYSATTTGRPDTLWAGTNGANVQLEQNGQPIDIYSVKVTNRCT